MTSPVDRNAIRRLRWVPTDFTLSPLVPHIRPAVRTKNGHWAVASVIIDATVSLSCSGERVHFSTLFPPHSWLDSRLPACWASRHTCLLYGGMVSCYFRVVTCTQQVVMRSQAVSDLQEEPQPSPAHTANRFRAQCSPKLLWSHLEPPPPKKKRHGYLCCSHMLIGPQQQWAKVKGRRPHGGGKMHQPGWRQFRG